MSTLRKVELPEQAQKFIDGAKTGAGQGRTEKALPTQPVVAQPTLPPELNPRVLKQVNISMPETDHFALKQLVATMPAMSMQRFILEAIAEKSERVRGGQ